MSILYANMCNVIALWLARYQDTTLVGTNYSLNLKHEL